MINVTDDFLFGEYGCTLNNIRDTCELSAMAYYRDTLKKNKFSHVYIIQGTHNENTSYKIGKANVLKERLKRFDVKIPFDIELVAAFYVKDALAFESELHSIYKDKRIAGEWFDLSSLDIAKIVSIGIDRERVDSTIAFEDDIRKIKEMMFANDKEYIEYLETTLVLNNIDFIARGV